MWNTACAGSTWRNTLFYVLSQSSSINNCESLNSWTQPRRHSSSNKTNSETDKKGNDNPQWTTFLTEWYFRYNTIWLHMCCFALIKISTWICSLLLLLLYFGFAWHEFESLYEKYLVATRYRKKGTLNRLIPLQSEIMILDITLFNFCLQNSSNKNKEKALEVHSTAAIRMTSAQFHPQSAVFLQTNYTYAIRVPYTTKVYWFGTLESGAAKKGNCITAGTYLSSSSSGVTSDALRRTTFILCSGKSLQNGPRNFGS